MAIKIQGTGYACSICGRVFQDPTKADNCRDNHDTIYVPLTRTELNRLINALELNQIDLVPVSLFETLRRFQKSNFRE